EPARRSSRLPALRPEAQPQDGRDLGYADEGRDLFPPDAGRRQARRKVGGGVRPEGERLAATKHLPERIGKALPGETALHRLTGAVAEGTSGSRAPPRF